MTLVAECRFAPHAATSRDAIYNGRTGVEVDRCWIESFGDDCWLLQGRDATLQVDHDTEDVGKVTLLYRAGGWWWATVEVEDEHVDKVRDLLKPGRPVSIGAQRLRYDDDHTIGIRQHRLCKLEHIALVPDGKHPGYADAAVTKVWERTKAQGVATRGSGDWRSSLPATHREFADLGDEYEGYVLTNHAGSIRWNGSEFVAAGGQRLAA